MAKFAQEVQPGFASHVRKQFRGRARRHKIKAAGIGLVKPVQVDQATAATAFNW